MDRLFDLAVTAFDENLRRQSVIAVNQRLSETAAYGPLYYAQDFALVKNRLTGPIGDAGDQAGVTWNIFEWNVSS